MKSAPEDEKKRYFRIHPNILQAPASHPCSLQGRLQVERTVYRLSYIFIVVGKVKTTKRLTQSLRQCHMSSALGTFESKWWST